MTIAPGRRGRASGRRRLPRAARRRRRRSSPRRRRGGTRDRRRSPGAVAIPRHGSGLDRVLREPHPSVRRRRRPQPRRRGMNAHPDFLRAPTAGAGAALELRGIAKNFGPVAALQSVSLTVRPGEVLAVTGPVGRRQDDAVPGRRRPRDAGQGPLPDRGARRRRGAGGPAPRRLHVRILRALSAHDGARQRHVAAARAQRPRASTARPSTRCSSFSKSATSASGCRRSCPEGRSSASRWRACWCSSPW